MRFRVVAPDDCCVMYQRMASINIFEKHMTENILILALWTDVFPALPCRSIGMRPVRGSRYLIRLLAFRRAPCFSRTVLTDHLHTAVTYRSKASAKSLPIGSYSQLNRR